MIYSDIAPKLEEVSRILEFLNVESSKQESTNKNLEEYDRKLREDNEILEKKKISLIADSERLVREREFNKRELAEARAISVATDKRKIELEMLNSEYEKKKNELLSIKEQLDKQLEKKKALDEQEEFLKERESVVNKEMAVMKETKASLDWRESKLKKRETYLQKMVDEA